MNNLLKTLISINHNEIYTRNYIKFILNKHNIPFKEDNYGNLFNFQFNNVPFLSSHMDTVKRNKTKNYNQCNNIIKSNDILGGDDACGITIILKLLLEKKLTFNWILTSREEIGGIGSKAFCQHNQQLLQNQLYGLILDRKGNSDIICTQNQYGSKELEDNLFIIGKKYNYQPNRGIWSDADQFSQYISCANLSVGFYNQHTNNEYINLLDLENAYYYTKDIIQSLKFQFPMYTNYCELCGFPNESLVFVESLQMEICTECANSLILELDSLIRREEYYDFDSIA